jgi:hypothetical protein
MGICVQQCIGSFMLLGSATCVFIGVSYNNMIIIAASPVLLLLAIFVLCLPWQKRKYALPYYSTNCQIHRY